MACISSTTVLCHDFLGLPVGLIPCGFHCKHCLTMLDLLRLLRVCPNHIHFLPFTCISIGSWLALFHRFSLLILSRQRMPRILLRHWLAKVWILPKACLVPLHVSAPSSRTFFSFFFYVASNDLNVHEYYLYNHEIRDLLFQYVHYFLHFLIYKWSKPGYYSAIHPHILRVLVHICIYSKIEDLRA